MQYIVSIHLTIPLGRFFYFMPTKLIFRTIFSKLNDYIEFTLQSTLQYITPFMVLGVLAFPIFYVLYRHTEILWLDIVLTLVCLLMLLYKHVPIISSKYLTLAWFFSLLILLPFNFTFNLLLNPFGIEYQLGEMVMFMVSIGLIANMTLLFVFHCSGIVAAVVVFFVYTVSIAIPANIYHMLPLYILGVLLSGILVGRREENHQMSRIKKEHIIEEKDIMSDSSRKISVREAIYAVAHELNQPLSALMNYSNGCKRILEKTYGKSLPDNIRDALDRSCEQAQRAGDIIHALKNYFNNDLTNKTENNINTLIENVIEMNEAQFKKAHLNVILKLATHLQKIKCDKVQIELVLINLINNACDSLSDRSEKKIVIETDNYLNDHIYISIADTGIGIDQETSKKIFFPFFSAKVSGLGIGLSLCENIIEQHQGKIEVSSIKDKGTIFKIWLPIK